MAPAADADAEKGGCCCARGGKDGAEPAGKQQSGPGPCACCKPVDCASLWKTCSPKRIFHAAAYGNAGGALVASGHNTMCCCVPLRSAVFFNALFTVIVSIFMVTSKRFIGQLRVVNGGYALASRVIIGVIEYTGILWGIMGVIGAIKLKTSYIRIYNYYQIVRVIAWLCMYMTDIPLLANCELWRTDIKAAFKQQGWNPLMYEIAMGNRCVQERSQFYFFSGCGLLFFIYLVHANQRLQDELEEEPRYLLRQTKDIASGAFYTQSLGQRSKPVVRTPQDKIMQGQLGPDGFSFRPGPAGGVGDPIGAGDPQGRSFEDIYGSTNRR